MPVLVKLPYFLTVFCNIGVLVNPGNENWTTGHKLELFVVTLKNQFFIKVYMDTGAYGGPPEIFYVGSFAAIVN